MLTTILLFFPAVAGLLVLLFKGRQAKGVALALATLEFILSLVIFCRFNPADAMQFMVAAPWIPSLGITFKAGIDGISIILVMLTTLLIPLIILSTFNNKDEKPAVFYALILFMQTGLLGVFIALDAVLFYVFWEWALIPIYFIAALWGGSNRISITFKFFIYTVLGSLFMLTGIIYLYLQTPAPHSFALESFYNASLSFQEELWVFAAFFLAFAIKMPVFPFHTWQPDTYTESPTAGTMLLAGIMLKMGIYGVIRWIIPAMPHAYIYAGSLIMILAIIGIVYASIIALQQNDFKRLIAYSSLAHVGLIAAGLFAGNIESMQGVMIQMLNHGVNVVGIFFILEIIQQRTATREIRYLSGIIQSAPKLGIFFGIIMFANIALPLTNGFIGEFLLLYGIFNVNIFMAVIAGLTIILGAGYMLSLYKNTMLGKSNSLTHNFQDLTAREMLVLVPIVLMIFFVGIYPDYLLDISEPAVANLLESIQNQTKLSFK